MGEFDDLEDLEDGDDDDDEDEDDEDGQNNSPPVESARRLLDFASPVVGKHCSTRVPLLTRLT